MCPRFLEGWEKASNYGQYRTKVGTFITYPIFYTFNERAFSLYIYQTLDVGDTFIGGSGREVRSARSRD